MRNRLTRVAIKSAFEVGIARAQNADAAPPVDIRHSSASGSQLELDPTRAALVVIDPQANFVRSEGAAGSVLGGCAGRRQTVENLVRLFQAAKEAEIPVAISRTAAGLRFSGYVPELKPYIDREATIICAPHTRYSPLPQVNDSWIKLRRRGLRQIILAGFIANLRLETHLRDFLELGFEVAVVRDAIAGPEMPEGQGYLSALINFRRVANALWTTEQVAAALGWAGRRAGPKAEESIR